MRIDKLCKSYGKNVVYRNFHMEVEDGKVTCLLGESGSGKTTLLNVIAGLTDYTGSVPQVKCSYVFQEHRLLPNLTVFQNLRLVCSDEAKIWAALEGARLSDRVHSYPGSLSGGQAQRASVLRAFLYDAELILMDEPFSSLDLKLKIKMMELFKTMLSSTGKTALFVTHDVDEAVYLADRIIVISGGKTVFDVQNTVEVRRYGANSAVREELIESLL